MRQNHHVHRTGFAGNAQHARPGRPHPAPVPKDHVQTERHSATLLHMLGVFMPPIASGRLGDHSFHVGARKLVGVLRTHHY